MFESSANNIYSKSDDALGRSFMYMMKRRGPRILPWGTPISTSRYDDFASPKITYLGVI